MVVGFLFSDGSRNTISWLVLPLLHLEWDVIGTYSWGPLHWLGCTVRYAMGAPGAVGTPPRRLCVPPTDLDVGAFPSR
jgi:hypothetical protein